MITIPSIKIIDIFDKLLRFYHKDYQDRINSYCWGYNDTVLISGFDWATTPESIIINNKVVTMNVKTISIESTIIALNAALSASGLTLMEFYLISGNINLRTISSTTIINLTISEGTGLLDRLHLDHANIKQGTMDAKETLLYQLFGENCFANFNYLDASIKLLNDTYTINANNKAPKLLFRLDYSQNPDNRPPLIIVTLANEQEIIQQISPENNRTVINGGNSVLYRNKRYNSTYKLNILSNSRSECDMIYNLIKGIIIGNIHVIEGIANITNINISGGDALAEIEVPDMFNLVITLNFNYQSDYPIIIDKKGVLNELITSISIYQ